MKSKFQKLPEDVRLFIYQVTLHLQANRSKTPEQHDDMFQRAYKIYCCYDVENRQSKIADGEGSMSGYCPVMGIECSRIQKELAYPQGGCKVKLDNNYFDSKLAAILTAVLKAHKGEATFEVMDGEIKTALHQIARDAAEAQWSTSLTTLADLYCHTEHSLDDAIDAIRAARLDFPHA